jgi:hypothetical protein
VARTLAAGIRTPDVAAPGSTVVGSLDMGRRIVQNLELGQQRTMPVV